MKRVDLKEQGRRVRAARAYLGVNADDLAKAVGIGKSTLLKIERGQRDAKVWELRAIAEECGVPRGFFEAGSWELADGEALEAEEIADEAAAQEDPRSEAQADEADR